MGRLGLNINAKSPHPRGRIPVLATAILVLDFATVLGVTAVEATLTGSGLEVLNITARS